MAIEEIKSFSWKYFDGLARNWVWQLFLCDIETNHFFVSFVSGEYIHDMNTWIETVIYDMKVKLLVIKIIFFALNLKTIIFQLWNYTYIARILVIFVTFMFKAIDRY